MDRSPHFSLSLNSHEKNTKTWVMHRALPTIPSRVVKPRRAEHVYCGGWKGNCCVHAVVVLGGRGINPLRHAALLSRSPPLGRK